MIAAIYARNNTDQAGAADRQLEGLGKEGG